MPLKDACFLLTKASTPTFLAGRFYKLLKRVASISCPYIIPNS
jgi:hypothetical protein